MEPCRDWTQCIAQGNSISHLEITSSLSDQDFVVLFESLKQNKTLKSLHILGISISVDACRKLGSAIVLNRSLEDLCLHGTNVSIDSVRPIMEGIVEASIQIVHSVSPPLSIQASSITDEHHHMYLGITSLNLSSNPLGDAGAAYIGSQVRKTFVSSLNVSRIGATTEGIKTLTHELSKAGLGTTHQTVKFNLMLTHLNLSHNTPGLDGIKSISDLLTKNVTLTSIELKDCQIGDTGTNSLCNGLLPSPAGPSTTRITSIDLSSNQIGDEGAQYIISLLKTKHTVTRVNLDKNVKISTENLDCIKTLTTDNQKLIENRSTTPWKVESTIPLHTEDGYAAGLTCSAILQSGLVYIGTSSGDIFVWDPSISSTSIEGNNPSSSSASSSSSTSATSENVVSPSTSLIKTGSIISKIATYDPSSRASKRRINALVDNLDGTVWCITDEKFITIIGIKEQTVIKRIPLHKYLAISIARYGPDVFIGGAFGEISLWKSDTMVCRHEIVLDGRFPVSSLHSDGKFIYAAVILASHAGHVLIFSPDMQLVQHFEAHTQMVTSIVTMDDKIVTSSWDSEVKIWTWNPSDTTISIHAVLNEHHSRVTSLVICQRRLISTGDDNTIIVWDITQPKEKMLQKRILGARGGCVSHLQAVGTKFVSVSFKEGRATMWTME